MADKTLAAAIARFEEARDELRDEVRLAHAATKDLRAAEADAKKAKAELHEAVQADIEAAVKEGVAKLGDSVDTAMTSTVEKVVGEFTKLSNLCLYGNETKRPGQTSLFEEVHASLQQAKRDLDAMREVVRAATLDPTVADRRPNPLGAAAPIIDYDRERPKPANRAERRSQKRRARR